MGLKSGDILTEILGGNQPLLFSAFPVQAAPYIAAQMPPSGLSFAVDRGGNRMETPIVLHGTEVKVEVLGLDTKATGTALEIRRAILGS